MKPPLLPLLFFLSVLLVFSHAQVQPSYEANNPQLDCANNGSTTLGYACDEAQRSCSTYLTFRSQTNYGTPSQIASLLNSNPSSISQLNSIPDNNSSIPIDDLVTIPTTCSCVGNYYQHNASYIIQRTGETYFTMANDTYQGLSTCQALIAQNPNHAPDGLVAGMKVQVPLRCACPTTDQITKLGVKYLLTYFVTWGDEIRGIAQKLNSNYQSVLNANGLSSDEVIYPFTTLLIPINTEPTKAQVQSLQAPPGSPLPPPSLLPPPTPPASSGSGKKWVYVGVGAGFLTFCGILAWYICCFRRQRTQKNPIKQGKLEESIYCPSKSDSMYKSSRLFFAYLLHREKVTV